MRPVTVQFLKNPDVLHWGYETLLLGEDEHGSWLALPKGAQRWKGHEPFQPTPRRSVMCAPHDGWWYLSYGGPVNKLTHFVDIVTQPLWAADDRIEMIDLDLDVIIHQDGTIEVVDEDEFEAHQVLHDYTEEMVRRARAETTYIVEALNGRREPFFEVAAAWLARVEH